jgi:peptidoglycan/LPS O-acetylase OafA/YrhL
MQSKNVAYIPRLDHLRFFAATIVFYFHMSHYFWLGWKPTSDNAWAGIITEGHTGVGLFFTLSGFLFMLIALGTDKIDYKKFMINRVLRIFPLFIFVFIIAISMSRDVFTGSDIFYILFSNLGKAPTSNYFITGAAWTISIEFTFYAVFPFLAMFAKDRGIKYLIALIGLILVFKSRSLLGGQCVHSHVLFDAFGSLRSVSGRNGVCHSTLQIQGPAAEDERVGCVGRCGSRTLK